MHRALHAYCPAVDSNAALIQRHAGMINRLARRLASRTGMWSAFDDLWSSGALGLLDAARRFDATREVSFETFAEHRVRGAMLDELRRLDHLPRRLRARTDEVEEAKRELAAALGHPPSAVELATKLKVDLSELSEIEALAGPLLPWDEGFQTASSEMAPDERVGRAETVRAMTRALKDLPERLRIVLGLHYEEGLTYREIAQMLEVSEPRVCQLHAEALAKLRNIMEAKPTLSTSDGGPGR
jgi:RNA polymerase sigma factor FliA